MSDTHLQNLEKAMNIAYEAGEMDKATIMAQEIQAYSNSIAPEEKTVGGFAENFGEDAVNFGGAVVDMATSPLDTSGAVIDLAVTGATNLLPESVVDDLYSYENDPNSMQYKLNETLKNNSVTGDFFNFLATQPRESYEKMGEVIADDFKGLIDDPVGRVYKKPFTTLLELTGAGRLGTTLTKTGKFGNTALNAGNKVDNLLDYVDPVTGATNLIGKGADKVKSSQMLKYSQDIIKNKGTDLGTKFGFKILPSTVKDRGGNLMGRLGEKLAGKKRTSDGVIDFNVKHADKLLRKHAGVTESTALGKVYDTLAKKSKPFYNKIAQLQGKTKRVRDDKIVINNVKQKQRGAPDRTVKRQETIEGTKTVQDIQSGQSILNKIESQKKINKKAYKDSRKENGPSQEKLQENANKLDNLHNELDRTIAYNKELAKKNGASAKELKKFDSMASNLKKARKNYAIGHSIENALNPDGTINLKKYANANRNNNAVTGSGRAVIDFYDTNPTLFKQKLDSRNSPIASILENPAAKASAATAATLAIPPLAPLAPIVGGSVLAADVAIPSILRSNFVQKGLLNKPRGSDVLNLLSNKKAVRAGAYTPSLLDSSNMEYLPELQYMQGNQ
mgnify:FL=1